MKKEPVAQNIALISSLASQMVHTVSEAFGNGKKGGYLYVCAEDGTKLLHVQLGEIPKEKAEKYKMFSQEKAERLLSNSGHVLSYTSRNPEKNMWGGAVYVSQGLVLSFSGFTEQLDEVFCATIARMIGLLDDRSIRKVLEASGNHDLCIQVLNVAMRSPSTEI